MTGRHSEVRPKPVHWVHVIPPRPGSRFRCAIPEDWERLPLLSEEPDFSDPTTLMPLGAFMAEGGSLIFSVTGRPAYPEGTSEEWLPHLCRHLGFAPGEPVPVPTLNHGILPGCYATQATSVGPMRMRIALFEKGGLWIVLTVMAPASRWESVEPSLIAMLASFELDETPTASATHANPMSEAIPPVETPSPQTPIYAIPPSAVPA